MSKVIKLVENFINQFDELTVLFEKTTQERSDIDKALSSWYHRVEGTNIKHVSESHNLIKEVKTILAKRRDIKIEEIILSSTCQTLGENIKRLKKSHEVNLRKDKSVREEIINRAKE